MLPCLLRGVNSKHAKILGSRLPWHQESYSWHLEFQRWLQGIVFILSGEVWGKGNTCMHLWEWGYAIFQTPVYWIDKKNLPVPGCFYKCHAFSLCIKSGVYLFVILSIHDSSVVTLSQTVLSIVQSDWSTDTPWLTQQLCPRRSAQVRIKCAYGQLYICFWNRVQLQSKLPKCWNSTAWPLTACVIA